MNITKDLIKKCNVYRDLIIKMFDYDVASKTRTNEFAYAKCVFYNVLKRKLDLNDQRIEEYFDSIGVKRNRSSVYHSLKKTKLYYKTSLDFRIMYDSFFDDLKRIDEGELKRRLQLKILKRVVKKDKLHRLLSKIPDDRRDEIFELVELRIKSWNWKNNDKTKEYNGSQLITQ